MGMKMLMNTEQLIQGHAVISELLAGGLARPSFQGRQAQRLAGDQGMATRSSQARAASMATGAAPYL
jgi:hypothetical protein